MGGEGRGKKNPRRLRNQWNCSLKIAKQFLDARWKRKRSPLPTRSGSRQMGIILNDGNFTFSCCTRGLRASSERTRKKGRRFAASLLKMRFHVSWINQKLFFFLARVLFGPTWKLIRAHNPWDSKGSDSRRDADVASSTTGLELRWQRISSKSEL